MIKVNFRKRVLIGISLALALCIVGIGAHSIRAASAVKTDDNVKITAEVDSTSELATKYKGIIVVKLYKLADMDASGSVTELKDDFKNAGINLSVLKEKPTVATVEDSIVKKAMAVVDGATPVATLSIDRSTSQGSAVATIPNGAGLYLYVPTAEDERYTYEFTNYVLFAPSSDFVMTGEGSDEWKYDVTFGLKSKQIRKYGKLKIIKQLDDYNKDLGKASFIYKIKAQLEEGTVVFDDVRTIEFNNAGTNFVEVNIPSTATVTVEETYPGASYELVSEQSFGNIYIAAGETKEVQFENKYDEEKLISGGISAVNTFDRKDGVYKHRKPQ